MKTLAIRGRPKMNNKLRRAGINCSIERDNTIRFSVNAENNRREPAPPPPVLLIFLKRPERSAGNNIVIARPWRVVGGWTGGGLGFKLWFHATRIRARGSTSPNIARRRFSG